MTAIPAAGWCGLYSADIYFKSLANWSKRSVSHIPFYIFLFWSSFFGKASTDLGTELESVPDCMTWTKLVPKSSFQSLFPLWIPVPLKPALFSQTTQACKQLENPIYNLEEMISSNNHWEIINVESTKYILQKPLFRKETHFNVSWVHALSWRKNNLVYLLLLLIANEQHEL